jgi:hypothetical protein
MFSKMKMLILIFVSSIMLPIPTYSGLAVDFGPFNFHMRGGEGVAFDEVRSVESPICRAIRDRDLVEIFVEVEDSDKKDKEENIVRLVVEPYTLGYNKDGAVVLRGFHIKEISLPENPRLDADAKETKEEGGSGFVGGVYSIFKGDTEMKDIKIVSIRNIKVLQNTDFQIRDKTEFGEKDDIIRVLCTLQQ